MIEAKDTVMTYKSVEEMVHTSDPEWVDKGRNIAEAQAEISFPLGKQVGIKEVVETDGLITRHILQDGEGNWSIESWRLKEWSKWRQKQLKEWGI